jgi:hypothetical protein
VVKSPNAPLYFFAVRVILSLCALYGVIGFMVCIRNNLYVIRAPEIVLFTVTPVFATNPIGVIFPSLDFLTKPSAVFLLSAYRFVTLSIISTTLAYKRTTLEVALVAMVLLYGIVEFCAGLPLPLADLTSHLLTYLHWGYAGSVFGLMIYALNVSSGSERFLLISHSPFIVACLSMTLLSEVYLKQSQNYPAYSILLYIASHIFSAVIFLFLQNSSVLGYENMVAHEQIVLDLMVNEEEELPAPMQD